MIRPKETMDTKVDSYVERFIDMKCSHCGYEEKMPDWCYGEEAEYLREIGDLEPPRWQCPKCYKETLCRKSTTLSTT